MSCRTYQVVPGETHLGRVKECTYEIPIIDIIDKFIQVWFDNGDYPRTIELDGFEFEFSEYFNDNDINKAEEYFRTTLDDDLDNDKFYELMTEEFRQSFLESYEQIEFQEYL